MEYPKGFVSEVHSRKPICGVLAVALCAGVSYEVAHEACKRNMPKHRKRFGGRTFLSQLERALKGFGVRFKTIKPNDSVTAAFFAAHRAKAGVTYLLSVPGHFITLRDGILIDQCQNLPYELHKCRNKYIREYIRIDGKGW